MSKASRKTVQVTRRFSASAERVFDAWLDPQRTGQWLFSTASGQMVRVEIDARVGGTFCFVDRRDGEDVEHTGTYLEIERPRRLVLTLAVHKASFTADFTEPTRIVIEIVPLGSGCELTLTHEDVLTDYADKTASGWGVVLDKLAAAVSRKEAAVSFLRLASSGKVREAYRAHVGPGFRHHNPYTRGDAESLMAAMEENAAKNPHKIFEVKRALEEGALVAVHSRVRLKPDELGVAVVHLFRFDGDRIVELWDVGQPVPPDSPNENGMF